MARNNPDSMSQSIHQSIVTCVIFTERFTWKRRSTRETETWYLSQNSLSFCMPYFINANRSGFVPGKQFAKNILTSRLYGAYLSNDSVRVCIQEGIGEQENRM